MSKVKRISCRYSGKETNIMVDSRHGNYVLYKDYEELLHKVWAFKEFIADLEKELDNGGFW